MTHRPDAPGVYHITGNDQDTASAHAARWIAEATRDGLDVTVATPAGATWTVAELRDVTYRATLASGNGNLIVLENAGNLGEAAGTLLKPLEELTSVYFVLVGGELPDAIAGRVREVVRASEPDRTRVTEELTSVGWVPQDIETLLSALAGNIAVAGAVKRDADLAALSAPRPRTTLEALELAAKLDAAVIHPSAARSVAATKLRHWRTAASRSGDSDAAAAVAKAQTLLRLHTPLVSVLVAASLAGGMTSPSGASNPQ